MGWSAENINFRKKTKYHVYQEYEGIVPERVQDTYTYAFLNSLDYTENCYDCKYAKTERVSDLTIGDAWGSKLPAEDQEKGNSLVLCQTEKGKELLKAAGLHLEDIDFDKAVEANRQLRQPSKMPEQRAPFIKYSNGLAFT